MKFIVSDIKLLPISSEAEKFISENKGKEVNLKEVRSDEQFNLFWKWMTILGGEFGYSKEEMKYWLFTEALHFTATYKNHRTGKEVIKDESVANGISKKRLTEIMTAVELFASENNIILPTKSK